MRARPLVSIIIAAPLIACETGSSSAGASESAIISLQGQQMQGQQMQGQQMQGASLSGTPAPAGVPLLHGYAGWVRGLREMRRATLTKGELSAVDADGRRISGAALAGVIIPAEQGSSRMWTVIRSVSPDPTFPEGGTSLYEIDVINADGTRRPLCRADPSGLAAAVPVAAIFDERGDRVESTTHFTFGCTAGAVAKCYRWGYRPWLNDDARFARLHWACTRMARADYCGDGLSWTRDGTLINLWDRAPAPGPFNDHGSPPPDFLFEAGWSTRGAVCLSKQRWTTLPPAVASNCPDRLIAPGAATGVATVCDSADEALGLDSTTELFNESRLNVP